MAQRAATDRVASVNAPPSTHDALPALTPATACRTASPCAAHRRCQRDYRAALARRVACVLKPASSEHDMLAANRVMSLLSPPWIHGMSVTPDQPSHRDVPRSGGDAGPFCAAKHALRGKRHASHRAYKPTPGDSRRSIGSVREPSEHGDRQNTLALVQRSDSARERRRGKRCAALDATIRSDPSRRPSRASGGIAGLMDHLTCG